MQRLYMIHCYIKIHKASGWTIRHDLILLWLNNLINITKKLQFHRPNISMPLSGAFIKGDLIAVTRGPCILCLLISLKKG